MARRLDKRLEHEAAERMKREGKQVGGTASKKKAAGTTTRKKSGKTAAKRTTARKKKSTTSVRRQLMWAVFNGAMKEEARFPYHDREAAEERLAALKEKSKKQLYFIQPIKVPLSEIPAESEALEDEELDEDELEAALDDEDEDGPSDEEE